MQNLEFWLTDAGIPYDVDASYNSIIVNANKLTPSHMTSFESLALKLFAAACNDHPGMSWVLIVYGYRAYLMLIKCF